MTCRGILVLMIGMALTPLALGAEPVLGRLFFTPAERAKLDARRQEAILNANRPTPAPVAEAPKLPRSQVFTLNGIVRRSDGEATMWINGKPVSRPSDAATLGARSIGEDTAGVNLPGSGKRVRLKVGQSVESLSGAVEESYRRRRTLPMTPVTDAPPSEPDKSGSPDAAPSPSVAGEPAR